MTAPPRIVLASTSRYRAQLLRRLLDEIGCVAPGVTETQRAGEAPADRAARLATEKARAVAAKTREALVIGSDQVADLDGAILDKPGDAATARAQLAASSGRCVHFHTAVCVIDTRGGAAIEHAFLDRTDVHFRTLDADTIARYVKREQPLDCAGSFKCEGLGISLFERIDSVDPTALIGLPLIALARVLRECGVPLP
ncbi:Maf family protein [Oleiagrimonas soli]|uniref:7-methyl-GTP pyrophosphatase n=1 Tax=Oleiagrimonas soli TaxID=1543381 RepID=A0A099CVN7_9GAMM|nr:Maf family protein [Oleiagrimonas soli]KGI77998.1 septum formation inhibitor Maf [Oleiagrimonas soli]MBB6183618.1 septum formation protein [Oleiagrimonas soli]